MREIKFRIWDGMVMRRVNVLNMEIDEAWEMYNWHDHYGDGRVSYGVNEKGKLMQFTGLLDKNGMEIYEGDTVSSKNIIWEENAEVIFSPKPTN